MESRYLNRKEAATHISARGIPCAASTLAKYATIGGSPRYRVFGSRRVVYTVADLDAWIEARLSDPKSNTAA